MSRTSKDTGASSPVKKYVSFSGSTGKLRYFDKESTEDDKYVYFDSIDFVVLDTKASISGFNENESCGINSNLLNQFELGKNDFVVKTKVNGSFGEFARGKYKDIKDKCFAIGGRFTTNIFALADLGDGQEIVRIELSGSSLGPWIDFESKLEKGTSIYDYKVTIKTGALCGRKNGKTYEVSKEEYNKVVSALKKDPMAQKPVWFYVSAFEANNIVEETVHLANDADEVLQAYLDSAPSVDAKEVEEVEVVEPETVTAGDVDDLPF